MKKSLTLCCVLLAASLVGAQEILFDQMVEAGGLKCYPVYGDDTSWYYLPDQPHVAADANERPQFSFLMYSMPEQRGEEGITKAPGGGVTHFLVAYDVPPDMVRRAQSELARTKPGAQLKGPVAYTDGTFNLVTAVTDPEAGLSRRVVGVGNAPIMSGHKAAVSMHLTPTGAMLLWESFRQRTPDISVNFEMTVSGYRNPVEAEMTFNYERIHQTMEFEAGIESNFLEADVNVMLGEMVDNGSINIELKGAPPEQWNDIQKLGIDLAKHHLFESLGAAPISQLREATRSRPRRSGSGGGSSGGGEDREESGGDGDSNRQSALENPILESIVMVTMPPLSEEAEEALARGQQYFEDGRYQPALDNYMVVYDEEPSIEYLVRIITCHIHLGNRDLALQRLGEFRDEATGVDTDALDEIRDEIERADEERFRSIADPAMRTLRQDLAERFEDVSSAAPTGSPPSGAGSGGGEEGAADEPDAADGGGRIGIRDEISDDDDRIPLRDVEFEERDEPELRRIEPPGRRRQLRGGDEEEDPIRLTVSFRMRRIERSGSFTLSMKQWNRVELPVRFAANIGNLSRYMDDSRMFRRVSLNDPMFKQREIPVTVDVASEEAFAAMLNAVTVTLRKRHQSGTETLDEVTIQRSDFSSGELETMVYGWDGDDNRTRWLDYDHRVRWNYLGGPVIETDWQRTSAGALVLSPPLLPREVTLEADPIVLREQGVRDVVVEVRYPAVDTERKAHATLRPTDEVGRQVLVLYQDPQEVEYSYSFDWRLYGGRKVKAGPFTDTGDYIYLDEIPRE